MKQTLTYLILCIAFVPMSAGILNVRPTTANSGDPVLINYRNAPAGAMIGVYTTTSRVPRKKTITVQSGMPSAGYRDTIPAGEYIVRCTSAEGEVLDSVRLTIRPSAWVGDYRFAVVADPHVMAPQLYDEGSAGFRSSVMQNRKMLHLSASIFHQLVDSLIDAKPNLLLVPGDLTKDGEMLSHQLFVHELARLDSAGIRTLVVPGNHDISAEFPQDTFLSFYAPYGYDTLKSVLDPHSLSYITQLTDSVSLLALDSHTGVVSDSTINWALAQADTAAAHRKRLIAMTHYGIVNHFNAQDDLVESSQIAHADSIANLLATHGVHYVFTGHFHITNASKDYTGLFTRDSIWEISTGSPITFPCHYKQMSLNQNGDSLGMQTQLIRATDTIADLQTYAMQWAEEHINSSFNYMCDKIWTRVVPSLNTLGGFGSAISKFINCLPTDRQEQRELTAKWLKSSVIDIYLTLNESDESQYNTTSISDEFYTGVSSMIQEIMSKDTTIVAWQQQLLTLTIMAGGRALLGSTLTSILTDTSHYLTTRANVTADKQSVFLLPEPKILAAPDTIPQDTIPQDTIPQDTIPQDTTDTITPPDGIEPTMVDVNNTQEYDILGRPISRPQRGNIYIKEGKAWMKNNKI